MTIRKGMCHGCPWNFGDEATEQAYNYGCLPSVQEATADAKAAGGAWACHSEPDKICCGFAGQEKCPADTPLFVFPGVHLTAEDEHEIWRGAAPQPNYRAEKHPRRGLIVIGATVAAWAIIGAAVYALTVASS